jgi:hypothetical protein
MERRALEALQGGQLSLKVVVTVGKLQQDLFISESWSILLEMYALKGIPTQFGGQLIASTHLA